MWNQAMHHKMLTPISIKVFITVLAMSVLGYTFCKMLINYGDGKQFVVETIDTKQRAYYIDTTHKGDQVLVTSWQMAASSPSLPKSIGAQVLDLSSPPTLKYSYSTNHEITKGRFSGDGKFVVLLETKGIQLLSNPGLHEIAHWDSPRDQLSSIDLSPNGQWLGAAGPRRLFFSRLAPNSVPLHIDCKDVTDLMFFGANSNVMLVYFKDKYEIRELPAFKLLHSGHAFGGITPITCLSLSRGGEHVAFGGQDGSIAIWNSTTQQIAGHIQKFDGRVDSICFLSSDEMIVVTGHRTVDRPEFLLRPPYFRTIRDMMATLKTIEVATGTIQLNRRIPEPIGCLRRVSNSKQVLSMDSNRCVQLLKVD